MFKIWFEREMPQAYASLLEGVAEVLGPATATSGTPLVALPGAHAIIAGARLHYNHELMDKAPNLRVICRTGIGIDNISIPDATARRIAVCNVPDGPTLSTAEHAITLMLAVAKQLKQAEHVLRRGAGQDPFNDYAGIELHGRCLGLIGLGRIGRHVATVALALGMNVIAYDPYLPAEQETALGVTRVPTLTEVLVAADIVSLHVPLTDETRHLINAERLAQMKRGAILINSARGGLVDESVLVNALESGHLQGVGLDVFDPEPPRLDHPLLGRKDVVATPHIAGATDASKERLWRSALTQALQVLRGERPPHLVNPMVWPPAGAGGR